MLHFEYPGPGLDVSYHNHSDMSDGSASPEETCLAAKEAGLREFGMSDHWVIPPAGITDADDWRMAPERLDEYVTRLGALKKRLDSENFTLRIGLEVDFFFENYREVVKELASWPIDYLIGSVHYAGPFPVDHDIADWKGLSEEEISRICEEYWRKLAGAALCSEFAFIGHLDLPKKFGFVPNESYLAHARRVLDNAAKTGCAIELNTSGWFKPCAEQYPALSMLREAAARRIPAVVTSDAHHPAHVKRNFAEGGRLLAEAGYPARRAEAPGKA